MTEENEKIAGLEAEIATLKAQTLEQTAHISKLNEDHAKARLQRNEGRKQLSAMRSVLSAHNVNFDPSEADLSGLKIEKNTGNVIGEFQYAAKMPSAEIPRASGDVDVLDDAKISAMNRDQINENWEHIMKLDKAGSLS